MTNGKIVNSSLRSKDDSDWCPDNDELNFGRFRTDDEVKDKVSNYKSLWEQGYNKGAGHGKILEKYPVRF